MHAPWLFQLHFPGHCSAFQIRVFLLSNFVPQEYNPTTAEQQQRNIAWLRRSSAIAKAEMTKKFSGRKKEVFIHPKVAARLFSRCQNRKTDRVLSFAVRFRDFNLHLRETLKRRTRRMDGFYGKQFRLRATPNVNGANAQTLNEMKKQLTFSRAICYHCHWVLFIFFSRNSCVQQLFFTLRLSRPRVRVKKCVTTHGLWHLRKYIAPLISLFSPIRILSTAKNLGWMEERMICGDQIRPRQNPQSDLFRQKFCHFNPFQKLQSRCLFTLGINTLLHIFICTVATMLCQIEFCDLAEREIVVRGKGD